MTSGQGGNECMPATRARMNLTSPISQPRTSWGSLYASTSSSLTASLLCQALDNPLTQNCLDLTRTLHSTACCSATALTVLQPSVAWPIAGFAPPGEGHAMGWLSHLWAEVFVLRPSCRLCYDYPYTPYGYVLTSDVHHTDKVIAGQVQLQWSSLFLCFVCSCLDCVPGKCITALDCMQAR